MANEDFTRFQSEGSLPELPQSPLSREEDEYYVADAPLETPPVEDGSTEETAQSSRAYRRMYKEDGDRAFEKPKTILFSLLSLTLAVVALACGLFGFVGAILGAVAIVLAIVSRFHLDYFDPKSVIALTVGIVAVIFGLFIGVLNLPGIFSDLGNLFGGILEGSGDLNVQA